MSNIGKKKSFFKDMKDSFVEGYRQVPNEENQIPKEQVSKTEKINRILSEAESLTIDENFLDAWQKWDDVVTELDVMIRDTKLSRGLAKGAGWASAFLTGGLGPSDVLIVPLVSKGLMKIFGVNLNFLLDKLENALSKRHYCMDREPDIARISDFHSELAYFCWCKLVGCMRLLWIMLLRFL